ncbi:MAG: ATP-binding protein [Proteobacteria bacterium]|nr:ATP-binding protein [Pseudomonadota bacterium]
MLNKFVGFVQDSDFSKYFIVGLVVAIVHSLTGYFSIFSWVAVLISSIPVIVGIAFFTNTLSYDQKQQIQQNSLLLSSIAWSVFMWDTLNDAPQAYTVTFVVISVSALLVFNHLKIRLILVTPVLLTYLILLLFVHTPAEILLAGYTLLFLVLWFLIQPLTGLKTSRTNASEEHMEASEKMDFISRLDLAKTDNQKLINKIKQSELDLSAAEMAKMEFLATMSHEIRTPLNGIIPLLDILLDSELSDFQRDYLSTAHVSAIQMQKLIDDLLDYSKVEAGKLSVEVRGLKILRVMASVNSSYQQAAQKKNLSIEVNIHHNVSPLLRGDPTRLRQVLSNLLSNAVKFSNRGTITLTAKKIKDYPNKEVVRFEVADQGIGLDQETCDSIFLPFTQEDASSTRKFGGTGLGLAISKKIVELMNGSIYVDSVKGKGSTFYFDLPLLKSMGETSVGLAETTSYQAILVNTNPLLFNKISKKLKQEEIPFQKALGLTQAMDMYRSIKNITKQTKNVLLFIDFETAGRQVRDLCEELNRNKSMEQLHACILTDNNHIAGIPQLPNIQLVSKDISIADYLNKIEVLQASDGIQGVEFEAHPASDIVEQERSTATAVAPIEPISSKHLESIRPEVLLVEDNEVNLKVAEKLIQYIGYPFDFALNGQEALEKVKQRRYRMILMDCQMPVMDGYKCTSKIRDYEQAAGLNRTPIMAMTANAMMGDREKCLDAGMDDYMSKPLNRYILEKTLKKWDPLVQSSNNAPNTLQGKSAIGAPPAEAKTSPVKPEPESEPEPAAISSSVPKNQPTIEINQKWLSTKTLEDIKEFMGDEMVQLLEMFEQETPSILKKMYIALKNNNFDEVGKMAHMLKSTSANIGANGLSFFSRKMELGSNKGEKEQLVAIFTKIKKAYVLTSKEISKYIEAQ